MNTSNGASAGQSNSITHRRPSVDSPQCRRHSTATDAMALDPATSRTGNTTVITQSPRDGTTPQVFPSYASGVAALPLHDPQQPFAKYRRQSSKPSRPTRSSVATLASPTSHFDPPSDTDLTHHLYRLLEQVEGSDDVDLVDVYQNASMLPPVTHDSLCELDIVRIINNPKLRHDVNFDKDLHFRPNLDGSRGRHKLKAAEDYWKALIAELELYREIGAKLLACTTRADADYWTRMMTNSQKRMPGIFDTIRDVLKTLVPERDQPAVTERLDVAMIMQQISKGLFDLMSLAQWLARLLKAHCAPMRDDWIDQMVTQTQRGVTESSQERIVHGLRQLLGILEAMKLDVANHQIRHLRGLLIEDTISFQQRYHVHRLSHGRIDVPRAKRWLERGQDGTLHMEGYSADKLQCFTSAILQAVLSSASMSNLPETFQLDCDRLRSIRHDLHHLITLDMCCDMFEELVKDTLSADAIKAGRTSLRASLGDILGDRRRPTDQAGNIAVEIVRLAAQGNPAVAAEGSSYVSGRVEEQLKPMLSLSSASAVARAQALFGQQALKLYTSIKNNLKLTTTGLHEAMITHASSAAAPFSLGGKKATKTGSKRQTLDDVLRRLTHVAVLHWHVWSPIVYTVADEVIGTIERVSELGLRESSSGSSTGSDGGCSLQTSSMMASPSPPPQKRDSVTDTSHGPVWTEPKA